MKLPLVVSTLSMSLMPNKQIWAAIYMNTNQLGLLKFELVYSLTAKRYKSFWISALIHGFDANSCVNFNHNGYNGDALRSLAFTTLV